MADRGDSRTRAQRNKAVRQEALREQISAQKHELYLLKCAENIGDVDPSDAHADAEVRKWKAKAEIHLRLLDKYLPGLKSIEHEHGMNEDLAARLKDALERDRKG